MNPIGLWPFVVYFAAVIVVTAGMIVGSYFLGERHNEPATGAPYESGILATGSARMRMSVMFYMVAMFFVIVDVESIFVFAWAVSVRQVGWTGYVEMLIFIGILIAALAYLWRLGALDWNIRDYRSHTARRIPKGSE